MTNGVIPEQEKPENQAPEVAYVLDQMTGRRTPIETGSTVDPEEKPKRRGRRKAEVVEDEADKPAEDEDHPTPTPAELAKAVNTRELGS